MSTGSSALQKVYTGSLNGNGGTDWHIGAFAIIGTSASTVMRPCFCCLVGGAGADVRAGALRLPLNGNTQVINETDFFYSGIYVEDSGPTTMP